MDCIYSAWGHKESDTTEGSSLELLLIVRGSEGLLRKSNFLNALELKLFLKGTVSAVKNVTKLREKYGIQTD